MSSLPEKHDLQSEQSCKGWLRLIFSKVDTKVGKAKSELGGMTSTVAAPNIALACNSGADGRQVQALEAPTLCPCKTQSALYRDDCSNGLFPTEPI